MASKKKESPWFKFKVNYWITGDIQFVSPTLKGIFMDICAFYWSKECSLSYDKCVEKFTSKVVSKLVQADVLKRYQDNIRIDFLDEQWQERHATSLKNKDNANSRWNKEASETDATASSSQCESDGNKRENKKEIKNKREIETDPNPPFFRINDQIFLMPPSEYFTANFSGYWETCKMQYKNLAAAALKKLDLDYFGYTFNEVNHIRNSFKTCLDKEVKDQKNGGTGTGPANKVQQILSAADESARQLGLKP